MFEIKRVNFLFNFNIINAKKNVIQKMPEHTPAILHPN